MMVLEFSRALKSDPVSRPSSSRLWELVRAWAQKPPSLNDRSQPRIPDPKRRDSKVTNVMVIKAAVGSDTSNIPQNVVGKFLSLC